MARCNCSGSTCSCKLQEGNGIAISGSGSSTDPYVIDATGDIEGTVQFLSTPTVEFVVAGQGTSAAPFQVQANAVVAMDELTDVHDPTGPAEGEVPVWTTDHWEFKTPASAPPGAVNVGGGLSGDGSAGNPIKASVSGIWGSGTMATPPWPTDSTVGTPVYLDSNGQLRARPRPVSRVLNTNLISTSGTGWQCRAAKFWRWGPFCVLQADMLRTGSALPASATGNIANASIGTLRSDLPGPVGGASVNTGLLQVNANGEQGSHTNFSINSAKQILLTNAPPNYSYPQNGVLTFTLMYVTEAGMEVLLPLNTLES